MRMRRALALLCALFCIWSSLFSAVFAVEIPPDLDDLDIDPWGDLGLIQETPEPTSTASIGEPVQMDPVELEPAGEGGIVPNSIFPGSSTYYLSTWGVSSYQLFNGQEKKNYLSFSVPSSETYYSTNDIVRLRNGSLLENVFSSSVTPGTYNLGFFSGPFAGMSIRQNKVVSGGIYQSIVLSGSVKAALTFSGFSDNQYDYLPNIDGSIIPVDGYFTVNDIVFSSIFYPDSSGIFRFDDVFIDITSLTDETISSIGFLFEFSDGTHIIKSVPVQTNNEFYSFYGFLFDDSNLSLSWRKESGSTSADDQKRHEETKGLLGTIISWLTSIRDSIGSVFTAIIELPGRIATALIEGIKSLFIPDQEDVENLKDQYETLLSTRLGFIWQAGEWITSFGSNLLSALSGGSEAEFVFPGVGFDMNGEHYQLIEQQTVDFDANGIVTVIRPFVGTIVALVVVAACVNLFHDMVGALISGKSYFDFLKGGGG